MTRPNLIRPRNFFIPFSVFCLFALLFPAEGRSQGASGAQAALNPAIQEVMGGSKMPQDGRAIYLAACATCHGYRGDGRGVEAANFIQPATDFTKGVYKFRMGENVVRADVERSIREGMSGTEMVPFKRILSPESTAQVAAYLLTLKAAGPEGASKKAKKPRKSAGTARTEARPIPERPFPPSAESVSAGKTVYQDNCSDCHGDNGAGSKDETDDWDRPVQMNDFRWGFFKSGNADSDLYRSILAGMKGTTMDAYDGELEDEEIWQVVDYIRSLSARDEGMIGKLWRVLLGTRPSGFDYRNY